MDQLKKMVKSIDREEDILNHGIRVSSLARELALISGVYLDVFKLTFAARYHDIGKVFIPQNILNKPEKLCEFEYHLIQQHPIYGYRILKNLDVEVDITEMVLYHHENYDGSGYNYGLQGKEILIGARIIRICDTFDALTSNRSYRMKSTPDEAIEIMNMDQNKYDPELYINFRNLVLNLSMNINTKGRKII